MSTPQFVHLHLHTQYSLLQGAIRIKPLFKRVAELGMPAVAITDSHQMFGAVDFYLAAKDAKIKPILGAEISFQPWAGSSPIDGIEAFRWVALAKNREGYRNLSYLLTRSYQERGSAKSVSVPAEWLRTRGEGLVMLSGDLRGEIGARVLMGDHEGAIRVVRDAQKLWGQDFYLEVVDSGIPEQERVNQELARISEQSGVPLVASSNCHYLSPEDAESHEILQCIEGGRNLDFDRPQSLVPREFWLKPAELMRERMNSFPGACDQTLAIAEKIDFSFKFKDEKGKTIYHLPNFRPEGVTKEDAFDVLAFFREQARKGLERRFTEIAFLEKQAKPGWAELEKEYRSRLEDEIGMIERTGFTAYFLIVADFINWAKERSIPVGPGRGSGAGSLVAYSLRITDIDPVQFKLLFERFINPERVSMPDFDVDFCQDRRGEVIDYVTRKYGKENVTQIITFGKLQAKAVVKDVGRVLGLSFAEADQLTKLFPDELNIKLGDAIEKSPELKAKLESDPKLGKVMEYALKLEGLFRNAGVHAAGVIITEDAVVEHSPLYVGAEGVVVTQFDKDYGEKIGLVKYDFLGLKTLTVIDNAVRLVREAAEPGTKDVDFSIEGIRYDDPAVFALISSGDTDGVFQVESSGMKDLCSRIIPNSVEDLTAINALFRPGPLGSGMVDDFIDCKHGRKQIVFPDPRLDSILRDTYGVILYQEQVMQVARELAGYSLGQADMLRRAMGKKKAEEMAEHKAIFVKGATERGLERTKAETIFDLMAKFAEYGFNKSHSAAYAVLTYQTAYLKNYYPAEFMAALMTTEAANTDKITKYITGARERGLRVLPPDVNSSLKSFRVEKVDAIKAIRFGLEAIKGVGGVAIDEIIESRTKEGPYTSVLGFCTRVSTRKVNKKVVEALTLAGAFDSVAEKNRATIFVSLEGLLKYASELQEEKALGQSSFFDQFSADSVKIETSLVGIFKDEADWPQARKFQLEKQTVGFYVSGHPLEGWQPIFDDWLGWNTAKLKAHPPAAPKPAEFQPGQRPQRKEVQLGGMISELKEITTKKGTRMAFLQLEDLHGGLEVVVFPDAYQQLAERLKIAMAESQVVVVTGDVESRDETVKVLAKAIEKADDAHQSRAQQILLRLRLEQTSLDQLRALKNELISPSNRGKCPVLIDFEAPRFKTRLTLPKAVRVAGTPQMVARVNRIFGASVVEVK